MGIGLHVTELRNRVSKRMSTTQWLTAKTWGSDRFGRFFSLGSFSLSEPQLPYLKNWDHNRPTPHGGCEAYAKSDKGLTLVPGVHRAFNELQPAS